jgi:hypothetical protein
MTIGRGEGIVTRHWRERNEWAESAAVDAANQALDEELAHAMLRRGEIPRWCRRCGALIGGPNCQCQA